MLNELYKMSVSLTSARDYIQGEYRMNKQIIFIGGIAAFCVLALVVSTVGAAVMTHSANGRNSDNNTGQGKKMFQEGMITALAAQGVDVSGLRTALQNDDKDAMKAWLSQYRETHVNGTADGNSRQIGTRPSSTVSQHRESM
jgi:hypothetical protein